jgi:hypothetical protein
MQVSFSACDACAAIQRAAITGYTVRGGCMQDTANDAVEKQGTVSRKHVVSWGQFVPGLTVNKLEACLSVVGSWDSTPRHRQGTAAQVPVSA